MRAANAYQSLHDTHDKVEAGNTGPGTRYEPLRETQYEVDADRLSEQREGPTRPDPNRSIESAEARRAALDQDLAELREASRVPERSIGPQHASIDDNIERALALQDQPSPDQPPPAQTDPQAERIGPERWTDRGGMVEQQASAMEWLRQTRDERREQPAPEQPKPSPQEPRPASQELSREDRELLDAARVHEAQTTQQEHAQSHHRDYPAP
jgi:hypothetical protein